MDHQIRILCVEDNEDLLDLLTLLLESEGYEVACAANVAEGLAALRERPVDLLVSDYSLPDGTGTEMIKQAQAEQLLHDIPMLLVTATMDPERLPGLRILQKPVDVDDLLHEVRTSLATARERVVGAAHAEAERTSREPAEPRGEIRLELALYLSRVSSPSSLKVLRAVQSVLSGYVREQVSLAVYDLSKQTPPDVERDRVTYTPTLVKRYPMPRAWLIGTLSNPDALRALLDDAGVERKT